MEEGKKNIVDTDRFVCMYILSTSIPSTRALLERNNDKGKRIISRGTFPYFSC